MKDPHSEFNKLNQNIFLVGAFFISKIPFLAFLAEGLGRSLEILRIYYSQKTNLNLSRKKYLWGLRREHLWETALAKLNEDPWVGFEFGVAWGYSSLFHISKSTTSLREWHGFDTFTGLPESWRHYKAGHFSNEGRYPKIRDSRIVWHKGLVQDTVKKTFFNKYKRKKKYIIIDLDLFEPTFWILSNLAPYLKAGDLIYFDEPNDLDEGSLLHIFWKLNDGKLSVVESTPCQVLVQIEESGIRFPTLPL